MSEAHPYERTADTSPATDWLVRFEQDPLSPRPSIDDGNRTPSRASSSHATQPHQASGPSPPRSSPSLSPLTVRTQRSSMTDDAPPSPALLSPLRRTPAGPLDRKRSGGFIDVRSTHAYVLDEKANSSTSSLPFKGNAERFYAVDSMLAHEKYNDEADEDAAYWTKPDPSGLPSLDMRGLLNVTTLFMMICSLLALFAAYPVVESVRQLHRHVIAPTTNNVWNIGGTNGSGQVPLIHPQLLLVDPDTPTAGQAWTNPDGEPYHLVFSDEFNVEGRTFWPGDDPFWEGVSLWYGATSDYEWYTPDQLNTTGGALQITLDNKPMNGLNFRSGMIQSWNKFCFQGGYIEFNAVLPGSPEEVGWWPGLWTQGNLGRPGYLATSDGTWPYSYDSCDAGILPNQTSPTSPGYHEVSTYRSSFGKGLSWTPGQRLSACTCPGEDHPGPNVNVGRGAPELDVLEAQIDTETNMGQASQSLQTAPFSRNHRWNKTGSTIADRDVTNYNGFSGNLYQESLSAVSNIPSFAYRKTQNQFTTFGCEFLPDFTGNGQGSVRWFINGKETWSLTESAMPPNPLIGVSQRLVPIEPMSIIMNLGISRGFIPGMQFDSLHFPATMLIDYVRVFQPNSWTADRISCDPPDHPTSNYIAAHPEAYNNPQLLQWPSAFPKNRLTTGC